MKRAMLCAAAAALFPLAGCNLVDSNGLHIGYSFDAQHFTETVGDEQNPGSVPNVPCTPGQMPDVCQQAQSMLPMSSQGSTTLACMGSSCAATASFTLPQKIDLRNAQTPLPSEAVQFGVSSVAIDRIAYWAASNTLDVATPPIDLWVAPDTAKDINDPNAVKLGTVASLPARSSACGDMADPKGDPMAGSQKVCDVPLTDAGQKKLSGFIQNFKTAPFQIFVHATLTAPGGSPLPAGTLDLFVRPSVTLSILK